MSSTLHEAIERVLRPRGATWSSPDEVANAIAERGLYSLRKEGTPPPAALIRHRARAHPETFDVDHAGRLRVAQGVP